MQNFEFYNPVNIIFGKDQLQNYQVKSLQMRRFCFTEAVVSLKMEFAKQVTDNLASFEVVEFEVLSQIRTTKPA